MTEQSRLPISFRHSWLLALLAIMPAAGRLSAADAPPSPAKHAIEVEIDGGSIRVELGAEAGAACTAEKKPSCCESRPCRTAQKLNLYGIPELEQAACGAGPHSDDCRGFKIQHQITATEIRELIDSLGGILQGTQFEDEETTLACDSLELDCGSTGECLDACEWSDCTAGCDYSSTCDRCAEYDRHAECDCGHAGCDRGHACDQFSGYGQVSGYDHVSGCDHDSDYDHFSGHDHFSDYDHFLAHGPVCDHFAVGGYGPVGGRCPECGHCPPADHFMAGGHCPVFGPHPIMLDHLMVGHHCPACDHGGNSCRGRMILTGGRPFEFACPAAACPCTNPTTGRACCDRSRTSPTGRACCERSSKPAGADRTTCRGDAQRCEFELEAPCLEAGECSSEHGVCPHSSAPGPGGSERPLNRVIAALRDATHQLEAAANLMECENLYYRADQLREIATQLRHEARSAQGGWTLQPLASSPSEAPPGAQRDLHLEIESLREELRRTREAMHLPSDENLKR